MVFGEWGKWGEWVGEVNKGGNWGMGALEARARETARSRASIVW